jgi:hypothetical protein
MNWNGVPDTIVPNSPSLSYNLLFGADASLFLINLSLILFGYDAISLPYLAELFMKMFESSSVY